MIAAQRPEPRPGVLEIAAYVPGRVPPAGAAKVHKLSSNETPLGPSPAAVEAAREAAGHLAHLSRRLGEAAARGDCGRPRPEPGQHHVRQRLRRAAGAACADLSRARRRGDLHRAWLPDLQDPHPWRPAAFRSRSRRREERADVDAILAAVTPRTRLVFLANPNNPTGTYLPFQEVRRLHAGLPKHVLLVLDAAYAEYVRRNDYEAGVELVAASENVVMTRTFSKIFGLAGLRIGWIYAPLAHRRCAQPRARAVQCQRRRASRPASPRSVTARMSSAAVAHNERWLPWLTEELDRAGAAGDAERRQFPARPLPGRRPATRPRRPTPT